MTENQRLDQRYSQQLQIPYRYTYPLLAASLEPYRVTKTD
jgi:hypothetical protein